MQRRPVWLVSLLLITITVMMNTTLPVLCVCCFSQESELLLWFGPIRWEQCHSNPTWHQYIYVCICPQVYLEETLAFVTTNTAGDDQGLIKNTRFLCFKHRLQTSWLPVKNIPNFPTNAELRLKMLNSRLELRSPVTPPSSRPPPDMKVMKVTWTWYVCI